MITEGSRGFITNVQRAFVARMGWTLLVRTDSILSAEATEAFWGADWFEGTDLLKNALFYFSVKFV